MSCVAIDSSEIFHCDKNTTQIQVPWRPRISTRITVIGGGVAGLSCACKLADAGIDVLLLEAGKNIGGRAYSFRDESSGLLLDNCQHVLLGCCESAIGFLSKIGSADKIDFNDAMNFVSQTGDKLHIQSSILPAPLHLLPSILNTNYLTPKDKFDLIRLMARSACKAPGKQDTAAEYLKSLSCSPRLMERVAEPILASALNEELDSASARYARMVLMETLLRSKNAYKLGVPRVPLGDLLAEPALKYLAAAKCEVRTAAKVASLNFANSQVKSITMLSGEKVESDFYVCAVPPESLARMGYKTEASDLTWHPIVAVHLFAEMRLQEFDQACAVGEPFQWVFNKSRNLGLEGTYIQAVASAADAIIDQSKDNLVALAAQAVSRVAPGLGECAYDRAIVYRSKRATFSTGGTSDLLRPASTTPLQNLFLAGDWTDTKWPATIEGAVRSGYAAAQALIQSI